MNRLEFIKGVLNIDDHEHEPLISFQLQLTESICRNYCGYGDCETIPNGLELAITQIAIDTLRSSTSGTGTVMGTGAIKSKKIGDVKIEYDVGVTQLSSGQTILSNYKTLLQPYCRVVLS